MSVSGVSGSTPNEGTTGPESTTGAPQGTPGSSGDFKPKISGLKDMSPEEWQKYLQMMAQNMCTDMKKHNDRLIEEMKKANKQG